MKYHIYCDESDKRGKKYSFFYGALIVKEGDLVEVEDFLLKRKTDDKGLPYISELKWYKISDSNWKLNVTERFLDGLFQLINQGKIKIRISFCQNKYMIDKGKTEEELFFLLYYQALKNNFCIFNDVVKLNLDNLPFQQKEKLLQFNNFLKNNTKIPNGEFNQINSENCILTQAIDLIIGGICFKLNEKDKDKINGRIGNRTKAKIRIYQFLSKKIRDLSPSTIYKYFNIGIETNGRDFNRLLNDKYRHKILIAKEKMEEYRSDRKEWLSKKRVTLTKVLRSPITIENND